jgi:RNA-binding motif X-linked protein 2
MNVVREIGRINAEELKVGIHGGGKGSWHEAYQDSAWVYIGGLSYELSEGDVICVMSQWGEVNDVNLVRDKETGKSQGFCFLKYEDQRSTILAVDNFNGTKLLGKTLRVDHVENYKLPKEVIEREKKRLEDNPDAELVIAPGSSYIDRELQNSYTISDGVNPWQQPKPEASSSSSSGEGAKQALDKGKKRKRDKTSSEDKKKEKRQKKEAKKEKKEKKEKKKEKKASKKMDKKEKKDENKA